MTDEACHSALCFSDHCLNEKKKNISITVPGNSSRGERRRRRGGGVKPLTNRVPLLTSMRLTSLSLGPRAEWLEAVSWPVSAPLPCQIISQ